MDGQRYAGNQAVARLARLVQNSTNPERSSLERSSRVSGFATVPVTMSHDASEQEAQRLAAQIMQMPAPRVSIQREPRFQRRTAVEAFAPGVRQVLRLTGEGGALPGTVRAYMEPRFGADLSAVRVHTGPQAEVLTAGMNARAVTYGHHIWLGKGQMPTDLLLMAHELTHVVQQMPDSPTAAGSRKLQLSFQRAVSTLCNAPSHWGMDPLAAAGFGLLAEKYIEADYVTKLGVVPGATAYFDNSFVGPIDPMYVAFLVRMNPSLSAAQIVFLTAVSVKRPDMLMDDSGRREFDEIKPDSIPGVWAGVAKLAAIDGYMSLLGLPYARGTSYTPTPRLPIVSTSVGGVPIEFWFGVSRKSAGLIVYELCIRTDWLKITITAAIAALLAILSILLRRPIPAPAPVFAANTSQPMEGASVSPATSNTAGTTDTPGRVT